MTVYLFNNFYFLELQLTSQLNCRLYLHSSEKCNGKKLININAIEESKLKQTIFIDCLKCVTSEDITNKRIFFFLI